MAKEITAQKWGNQREYVFALIGGAIGLGNVWRFPYLCYKNGGGAFLIPYFTFLFLGGIPIFILETSLGQFMQQAGITAWNLIPAFKGIGWCSAIIIFWLNCYYIIILGWALFYLINSTKSPLPWTTCDNEWNSVCCTTTISVDPVNNKSFLERPELCSADETATYPELEFWKRRTLQVHNSSGIDDIGGMRWEIVGTVFVMWVISYLCIFRGTKSTGKSVYITSTFPLVMMSTLIIRGVTLEGASKGLKFYLTPDFPKLLEIGVWIDAGTQVFFSYMIGIGTAIALGSYNDFRFNSFKWSLILCSFNASASFLSGIAIFSILGYMSTITGIDISEIAESGPGLAFIVYPRAVSIMPFPNLWAILFFTMLLMLGLASHYVGVDGLVAMIADLYPKQFKTSPAGRPILVGAICLICFLVGLPMMTDGGIYVFQIFDIYGASGLCLLWVAFFQTSVVSWIHGRHNYYKKMSLMYGGEINIFRFPWYIFGYLWQFVTPIVCMLVFIIKLTRMGRTVYDKTYLYPAWADAFGVCLASSSMIAIPIVFVLEFLRSNGGSLLDAYDRESSFLVNIRNREFYQKLMTAASNKWKDVLTERLSAETKEIIRKLQEPSEENQSSHDDVLLKT